jgi:hypothetical protein
MSDKPVNDPTATQRRRTFLKRMAAAGFAAGVRHNGHADLLRQRIDGATGS